MPGETEGRASAASAPNRPLRRIVVFTGLPDIRATAWWHVLTDARDVEAILVCRQLRVVTLASAWRSVRRNLRKHGILFVPWRVGHALVPRRPDNRPWPAPTREAVVEHLDTADLHAPDVLARVREFRPDLGISIGAPILRRSLFELPPRGTINLHSGRIPDFRGAPPGFWELYTGAREVGATIHWMDEGLDTGPVLCQAVAPIYPFDSLGRVEARAEELAVSVLRRALASIARGEEPAVPQSSNGTTYRQPTVRQRLTLGARGIRGRLRRRVLSVRSMSRLLASMLLLGAVRPVRDFWRTLRRRHPVRVFTFHRVTDLCRDGMTVSPKVFRRQVAYIRKHHDIVSLDKAIAMLEGDTRLRRPVAVITFDDGYRSVFEGAAPVMRQLGVVGCCFVCTDFVGTDRRFAHDDTNPARAELDVMDWREVEALRAEGWTIGAHTANHVRMSACNAATQRLELERSLEALHRRLGVQRVSFAYPFGGPHDITPEGVELARRSGYVAVFSDYAGDNYAGADLHALGRWELGGDHDPVAWRSKIHSLDLEQLFTIRRLRASARPLTTTSTQTA